MKFLGELLKDFLENPEGIYRASPVQILGETGAKPASQLR